MPLDRETNKAITAFGEEARLMLGRTPGNIVAVRPLRQGVISDYTVTEKMIKILRARRHVGKRTFKKAQDRGSASPAVPQRWRRKAVEEATYAGRRQRGLHLNRGAGGGSHRCGHRYFQGLAVT